MNELETTWGIVLAGGNGSRLQSLTRNGQGTVIPKQFCSFRGENSLLRVSIERLARVIDRQRIVVVVAAAHQRWWGGQVADLDPENVIVQPSNRGTACGIMLPLLHIRSRDPQAQIVVTPSDHFIEDEETYETSILKATVHVASQPYLLVVLGIEPDYPATDLGWVLGTAADTEDLQRVVEFVEKPNPDDARHLMMIGALWNSFTFVATVEGLLTRFRKSLPWLAEKYAKAFPFGTSPHRSEDLFQLYDRLPSVDFSQALLERSSGRFHVLRVPQCGWTDLGTPLRVLECVNKWGCPVGPICSVTDDHTDCQHAPIDLARAVGAPPRSITTTATGN